MEEVETTYSRTNPFMATLVHREPLTKPGSTKVVYHVELDLSGANIDYKTGDSVGIYPVNDPFIVQRILDQYGWTDSDIVFSKTGEAMPVGEYLSSRANINRCSKRLLTLLAERQPHLPNKISIEQLLAPDRQEELKQFLEAHEVWDLLAEQAEAIITPQELVDLLGPLLPRFYSIASSKRVVGESVHLTVSVPQYVSNGHTRTGVCSRYLCELAVPHLPIVPVYLQPSKEFTLPGNDDLPIIMIGPGTGVAPYRGFMQERIARQARGQNWLFFGERHRATDYLYEDYWHSLAKAGTLRVDAAFSRDQAERHYVQHRLQDNAAEIYSWLQQGAYVYVCGDAERMARDVDLAFHQIISQQGKLDLEAAKAYMKQIRDAGRYLRDIY